MERPFGRQWVSAKRPETYDAGMPSDTLLIGIAQLAVTIAGFAGVVAVFRQGPGWTALQALRLRVLVQASLGVMFMGLVPSVLRSAFADDGLAIRWASGIAAVWMALTLVQLQRQIRATDALPLMSRTNVISLAPPIFALALFAFNVFAVDGTRYVAGLLLVLLSAAVAFQRLIGVHGR